MSKESITLVYSAILREKHTILAEYTEFSGNFSQIITQIMKDIILNLEGIPNICRTYFFYGKYVLFLLKYNKLYIITLFPNVKINNKELIFAFLYSIFDIIKLKKEIDLDKTNKLKAYSLSYFSEIFKEKIKSFYQNCDNFIIFLKNLQSFPIFEIKEKQYEPQIQLPILSNEQTNSENEKKNEIMNKDKDKDDENIIDSYDNKSSFRSSLNSMMTYDSFRDDFLMNNQEQNDDSKDKSIEINEKKNNNISREYLQPLNVKIDEKKSNLFLNDTNGSSIEKDIDINVNNNTKRCKYIVIIIIVIILIIVGVILGITFS